MLAVWSLDLSVRSGCLFLKSSGIVGGLRGPTVLDGQWGRGSVGLISGWALDGSGFESVGVSLPGLAAREWIARELSQEASDLRRTLGGMSCLVCYPDPKSPVFPGVGSTKQLSKLLQGGGVLIMGSVPQ